MIHVCRGEACQSMGSEQLARHARKHLAVDFGDTTSDGALTLEQVFCLGNCALSPAVLVDGRLKGRVDEADFDDACRLLPDEGTLMDPAAVFVPLDAAARSVGAEDVATAIVREATVRRHEVRLVRNGSRGMFWLEPLVEVSTAKGRVAYGPVQAESVGELLDAGMLEGAPHRLCLGLTEEISHLKRQTRFTFERVGVTDPLSVADYEANGGLAGLRRALEMTPQEIVTVVTDSGLRGRGGAGFPTGVKWQTVLNMPSELKFIACNADEGDSGTFADRTLMEGDPFVLVEGMAIAGLAVGANEGYIYIRSEYPDAVATMTAAIDIAHRNGWVGPSVLGTDHSFDLHVRVGAGSYICGEETAMLESLEGRRGMVRAKPPLPAIAGLFGKPTVVNNVLSLATIPPILAKGAEAFRELGSGALARDSGLPAGRQHQARWHRRDRLRRHPRRARRGLRWRHCERPARCGLSRSAVRLGPTCRRAVSTCRWTTRPSRPRAP